MHIEDKEKISLGHSRKTPRDPEKKREEPISIA
jgi:hypothetical protein